MSELQLAGSQSVQQPIVGRSENLDIAGNTGYNNTIAQETRGSDARIASAAIAPQTQGINNQKVDSLAKEIITSPEFKSRDLAQKIHNLNVPERNSLVSKLGNEGRGNLANRMYKASTGNPIAYQTLIKDLTNGIPDAKTTADHGEAIKLVAADPNAIGFVSMGVLAENKASVWKVPVNFGKGPVVPSKDSVLNDTYGSLARPLYVYVTKSALAEKDGHTLGFITWLMERASKLAAYEGFIPLIDSNYSDGLRKLSAK